MSFDSQSSSNTTVKVSTWISECFEVFNPWQWYPLNCEQSWPITAVDHNQQELNDAFRAHSPECNQEETVDFITDYASHTSESERQYLRLCSLLSEQKETYGMNMIDSCAQDGFVQVLTYHSMGMTMESAFQRVFNEKTEILTSNKVINHSIVQQN